ncbi:MAG: PKD domain-containing protein [Microthrixaceae bacterium]|nr:PKD domain-containing protein [Microthrixaceae bacterium]
MSDPSFRGRRMALCVTLLATGVLVAACTPPPSGPGTPNVEPIAAFTVEPASGNAPLPVVFDASASSDPDGAITDYYWQFDLNGTDGYASGTGRITSHTYLKTGTYTVSLNVVDNRGAVTTAPRQTIEVNGDDDNDGAFADVDCDDGNPAIHPGADDAVGDDIDQNCDGYDGLVEDSVFVRSADGQDSESCGTPTQPCASIGHAQDRAVDEMRSMLLIAGGDYAGFELQEGLTLIGGFGQNWRHTVPIEGRSDVVVGVSPLPGFDTPIAVAASGITQPTTLRDLTLQGATAATNTESVTMAVADSDDDLELVNLRIIGGTGGAGEPGSPGVDVQPTRAIAGGDGQNSRTLGLDCDDSTRQSGGAGGGTDGSGGVVERAGGSGGDSGTADTSCSDYEYASTAGRNGIAGSPAEFLSPPAGGPGGSGGQSTTFLCGDGEPGTNGVNGARGEGGIGGATNLAATAEPGGDGGPGKPASGGGGGGGGSGCNTAPDSIGGGGGGGGQGGLPSTVGGSGGAGGGRSVALLLINSTPTVVDVEVQLGRGGDGGAGGTGGFGQIGGLGGAGGLADCSTPDPCTPGNEAPRGGKGGQGGSGGSSGNGGGGAGGAAIGVGLIGASETYGFIEFTGGIGGEGGPAGSLVFAGGTPGADGSVLHKVVLPD